MNEEINFENLRLRQLLALYVGYSSNNISFFDWGNLSTLSRNEYFPLINFMNFKLTEDTILYPKIKINPRYLSKKPLNGFISYLNRRNNTPGYIEYIEKGITKKLIVGFGFIMDEEYNYLFLISLRSHLLQKNYDRESTDSSDRRIKFTRRDVKIFISSDFMKTHRKYYNLLMRNFLQDYIDSGCELSIVDSSIIEDSVYGNEFESISNFRTIEDKLSFIDEFRNTILEYEQ